MNLNFVTRYYRISDYEVYTLRVIYLIIKLHQNRFHSQNNVENLDNSPQLMATRIYKFVQTYGHKEIF